MLQEPKHALSRLVASLGLKKVNGKTVHRRKNVLNLGPLSRHDDGKPDYLRRLRESYRAGPEGAELIDIVV